MALGNVNLNKGSAMEANETIELLNQKIPTNKWTLGIIIAAGLTIIGFHWLSLEYSARGVQTEMHGGPYLYQINNNKKVSTPVRQKLLIFWTPNKLTKLDIPKNEKLEPWYEVDDNEKKIKEFQEKLVNRGAKGYNRIDIYGKGTTQPKRGYLWRVTTDADNEKLSRENFVKFYSEFWGRTKDIYIEEYNFTNNTR